MQDSNAAATAHYGDHHGNQLNDDHKHGRGRDTILTRMLAPVAIAVATVAGTDASMRLIEQQGIGLPAAFGIVGGIVTIVLWWERRMTKRDLESAVQITRICDRLDVMDQTIAHMPCQKNGCNEKNPK